MAEELVLPDRLFEKTGFAIDGARRRDEREAPLYLVTNLVLAVDEEAVRIRIGSGTSARPVSRTRRGKSFGTSPP